MCVCGVWRWRGAAEITEYFQNTEHSRDHTRPEPLLSELFPSRYKCMLKSLAIIEYRYVVKVMVMVIVVGW